MELSEKEKKLLTILHEARVVNGRLLRDYEKEVREHFTFSNEELNSAIKKFLKEGLVEEIKVRDDDFMYMHTEKVTDEMVDERLSHVGYHT